MGEFYAGKMCVI
jgi:hypothetical protein